MDAASSMWRTQLPWPRLGRLVHSPAAPTPACSTAPLEWPRSAWAYFPLPIGGPSSRWWKQECATDSNNSQDAHMSAVGSWASRVQLHPSGEGLHVANSAASRCGVKQHSRTCRETPWRAASGRRRAIRLAEGVGGRDGGGAGGLRYGKGIP